MADKKQNPTDREIALGLQRRDEDALAAFRDRYDSYLQTVAMRILGNAADAEECVSDALQLLWGSPPDPDAEPFSLKMYAAKITRNAALVMQRKMGNKTHGSGEATVCLAELEELLPSSDTPQHALEEKELTALLNRFLRSLPPDHRRIFLRHYWFMESAASIAASLGKKEATVRTVLFRCRAKLRSNLEKAGY